MGRERAPGAALRAASDVGHLVLTAVTIVLVLSEIGFSAAGFGWWFRLYAIASALTVVVFGALTGAQATAQHRAMPSSR